MEETPVPDISQGMSIRKEHVTFSTSFDIKLSERSVYDEKVGGWFIEREAIYKRSNGNSEDVVNVNVDVYRSYETVLKNIAVKVKLFQYLNNEETLEALRKDILIDIVVLLYKLERGDTK